MEDDESRDAVPVGRDAVPGYGRDRGLQMFRYIHVQHLSSLKMQFDVYPLHGY